VLRAVRMSLAVLLVVGSATPVLKDANRDSYPFSTYPMFARPLQRPRLVYAEGQLGRGKFVRLPPELIANDEPMQAMRTLKLSANEGPEALQRLCASIASRVAQSAELTGVRRVRIVAAVFDPVRYFEIEPASDDKQRLMQCTVRR
jgi:hypothetical protein